MAPPQEQRNADHTFIAHPRCFGSRARRHDVVQRDDGRGGEIGVVQLSAGLVKHLAERQLGQFQMCGQGLEFRRREGGEKMVLLRTMGR